MKSRLFSQYGLWAKVLALALTGLLLTWGNNLRAQVLSPQAVDFGDVVIGGQASQTFTFTNNNLPDPEFPIIITSSISVIGSSFSIQSNGCISGLAPNDSCSIVVSFSPTTTGIQSGALIVDWSDNFEDSGTESASLTGRGVTQPPVAANDDATTAAGAPVTINVLGNDTFTPPVTVVLQAAPSPGTAAVNTDNTITYTPAAGFAGPDSFTYLIQDSFGQPSNIATVTVTVNPPGLNAVDDTATTPAGQSVTIPVLENDEGEELVIIQVSDPPNGSAAISGAAIIYTPNPGFASPPNDTFTYTIRDRFERTATATVTVTVNPPGLNAVDDTDTTATGTPITINVLANDTGEGLTLIQVSDPPNGSAVISGDAVVYTPNPGFASPPNDTFTYTIRDRFERTATATVTVTVNPPGLNAVDDAATTAAGTPVTINVLANDTGEELTLIQVSDPPNGTAAISGNAIVYTPAANFAGTDSFTYTIRDRFGRTATARVTVTVNPPALSAVDDGATTASGSPVIINVLANDLGIGLTVTQVGPPANGTAVANADGTITYTSAPNFTGTDTFTYTITDSFGQTDTATVTVTVTRGKEDTQKLLQEKTTNPNAKVVARTIGGLCFDRTASTNFLRDCDALIDAASNDDPGVGSALEQITPRSLSASADTSLTSAQSQMLGVRSRMISLRSGVMGINLDRLNIQRGGWTLSGQDLRYLLASTEGGGGPSADVEMIDLGPFGMFASGTIHFGDRDETENQAGFKFTTLDLILGADYRFSDQLILGAALSYTVIDTDIDNRGGYLDTRGYGLTLYGTYYPSERIYVEGMINYGRNDYDQRRNLAYQLRDAEANQSFDSSYDGRQFFAELGAGYEFTRGNLTFGPDIRLSYLDVQVDSFQERASNNDPGSAWAMAIDEQNLQSLVLSLSGRAGYLIDQPWGILQPQVEFSWLHEFDDNNRTVSGRFVEGALVPDNRFQLFTDPVDKNYFRLGLGLMARFDRGPSVLIQYRTLFDYNHLEQHSISTQFRWEF